MIAYDLTECKAGSVMRAMPIMPLAAVKLIRIAAIPHRKIQKTPTRFFEWETPAFVTAYGDCIWAVPIDERQKQTETVFEFQYATFDIELIRLRRRFSLLP